MSTRPNPTAGLYAEPPLPSTAAPTVWGSDAMAAVLRALNVPFIALNSGASYQDRSQCSSSTATR